MCHIQKKQSAKLDSQIVGYGLSMSVNTVERIVKKNNPIIKRRRGIIAQWAVMQRTGKRIGSQKISHLGVVVSLATKAIDDGLRKTLKEWHTLRLGDMQEKGAQKGHTLSKNGRSLKRNLTIVVRIAERKNSLLKIILFLYRRVAQITSQTSNRFVETAIAVSGRRFNIYQNPELLK